MIHAAEKMFPMAWDVIETLELYELPVTFLTSDGAQQNRRFYTASASLRVYRTNARTCIDTKVTSTSSVIFPTSLRLLEIASAIRSVTQRVARWRYLIMYAYSLPIDV